ncbi:mechanosensitive ion channel [Novosphingobium sp. KCTC 2891]|uniref:mechanosensitive ion channel family protein n=1 Tax=Novosphingobium sp. KCTC 2891 TaxID=2989730 RepID=UPI0022223B8B|nr:mechanosensitive ion channel domain-containing protein [Novosphingobium sp. KCTC 2891]MCW1381300.1 mechanosensitive ion channel [Novosphingobium sp. KCTC 2891]
MNKQLRDVSRALRDVHDKLDEISIDIGHYHISLLNALWMALVVALAILGARLGARIARAMVRRMTGLDAAQKVLTEKLAGMAIWAFAVFAAIDVLGISLTALTVFSGAFGLAIGFGLQKTFGNLIAGIILLMDRSIKPGDVIAVSDGKGNTFGEVKSIGIRAVSVTTRDNREYLIPNENLMTSQVENWSYSSREVAISIPVGVAYGSDIDLAERLLLEAARSSPRVLQHPAPGVLLNAFGPSAIEMQVVCWIDDPEMGVGNVRSEVLKAAWRLFRQQGVEIPFPQADVHLRDSDGLREVARILAERGKA